TPGQTAVWFLLVLPLALHSMYNGQANLTMLAALLLGLSASAAGRWNRAAAWLALAALIKGYPLALGLLLCALYPRRFAPRFAAAGIAVAAPFRAHCPSVVARQYSSWFHHLCDSTDIMRERLRSIDHLLQVYGHPISPGLFALVGLLTGVAVLALCLLHARRTE